MANKNNTYITLVRASADEIAKDYKEIIEGQIIFDTTNKTISCDEAGHRIAYVGNLLTKEAIGKELDASYDSTNDKYTLRRNYNVGEYFTLNGQLYTVSGGGMTKGRTFAGINFKTQSTPTRKVNLCDELKSLKTTTGTLSGTTISKNNFQLEMKGEDLYITKSW